MEIVLHEGAGGAGGWAVDTQCGSVEGRSRREAGCDCYASVDRLRRVLCYFLFSVFSSYEHVLRGCGMWVRNSFSLQGKVGWL